MERECYNPYEEEQLWTAEKEKEPPHFTEREPRRKKNLRDIDWTDGSTLRVFPKDRVAVLPKLGPEDLAESQAHQIVYTEAGHKPIDLASVVSEGHEVDFIGADAFWAYDTTASSGPDRESTVAIEPDELAGSRTHMLAVLHEMGHAYLYEGMDELLYDVASGDEARTQEILSDDRLRYLKPYFEKMLRLAEEYKAAIESQSTVEGTRTDINQVVQFFNSVANIGTRGDKRSYFYQLRHTSRKFEKVVKIFHERIAWAFAIKQARKHNLRLGFSTQTMEDYAEYYLNTYAQSGGDTRFNLGVADNKVDRNAIHIPERR